MIRTVAFALLLLTTSACGGEADGQAPISLACATSLRRVMPDLVAAYRKNAPEASFQTSYAGSGTLRQQVEAGAPVDGVLLAGPLHVDRLIERGLAEGRSLAVVARNELVLIGSKDGADATFAGLAQVERIAIADPRAVPAGRYAQEALEKLGLWKALQPRFVHTQDVAGVLAYVRRGEVAVGVAYATEVVGVADVRILDRAVGDWAPRPVVLGAVIVGGTRAEACRRFLSWLGSEEARVIWQRHGFLAP